MNQIYIEWRDAVCKSQQTNSGGTTRPASVLLRGTPWLVEETEIDLVVAGYAGDDGSLVDLVAIPKAAVEKREPYSSSIGGQQTTP